MGLVDGYGSKRELQSVDRSSQISNGSTNRSRSEIVVPEISKDQPETDIEPERNVPPGQESEKQIIQNSQTERVSGFIPEAFYFALRRRFRGSVEETSIHTMKRL